MKVTNKTVLAALAVGLGGFLSSNASAVQIPATISWDNDYRTGRGGEFTLVGTGLNLDAYTGLNTQGVLGLDSFQTFCIEYNESISRGQSVTYTHPLDDLARNGGSGGPSPDPVSQGTALLYTEFASGALAGSAGYDYSLAGRQASADQLQRAIWFLEQEISYSSAGGASNAILQYALTTYGYDGLTMPSLIAAVNSARASQASISVYAVNLYDSNGNRLQDQLYVGTGALVPDGGASVMLLGLALGGIGIVRRLNGKKG